MAILRCPKGHFYDTGKYDTCPHCSRGSRMEEEGPTAALEGRTVDLWEERPGQGILMGGADEEKTAGYGGRSPDAVLFTGWLVCTQGVGKGRDYRIYRGFNRLGRNPDSDIDIYWDGGVAGCTHCSVVYDDRSTCHYLVPGMGTITWLNGKVLEDSVRLVQGDLIRLGETELEFIPFCREGHIWEQR